MSAFVRRHGLVSFYALAYGLSWLAWIPWIFSQYGLGVLDIPVPQLVLPSELIGQLFLLLPGAYLGPLIFLFLLLCIVLSVVITWVFNRTNESLPLAIVIHASNKVKG